MASPRYGGPEYIGLSTHTLSLSSKYDLLFTEAMRRLSMY